MIAAAAAALPPCPLHQPALRRTPVPLQERTHTITYYTPPSRCPLRRRRRRDPPVVLPRKTSIGSMPARARAAVGRNCCSGEEGPRCHRPSSEAPRRPPQREAHWQHAYVPLPTTHHPSFPRRNLRHNHGPVCFRMLFPYRGCPTHHHSARVAALQHLERPHEHVKALRKDWCQWMGTAATFDQRPCCGACCTGCEAGRAQQLGEWLRQTD